jgi:hypothetical protein
MKFLRPAGGEEAGGGVVGGAGGDVEEAAVAVAILLGSLRAPGRVEIVFSCRSGQPN